MVVGDERRGQRGGSDVVRTDLRALGCARNVFFGSGVLRDCLGLGSRPWRPRLGAGPASFAFFYRRKKDRERGLAPTACRD